MMGISRITETVQRVLEQNNLVEAVGNLEGQTLESLRGMLEAAGHSEAVRQLIEQVEALPPAEAGELDEALEVVGTDAGEAQVIEVEAADADLVEVLPAQEANGLAEGFSKLHDMLETVQETLKANEDAELEVIHNVSDAEGPATAIETVATDDDALVALDSDGPAATNQDAANDHQPEDDNEEVDAA